MIKWGANANRFQLRRIVNAKTSGNANIFCDNGKRLTGIPSCSRRVLSSTTSTTASPSKVKLAILCNGKKKQAERLSPFPTSKGGMAGLAIYSSVLLLGGYAYGSSQKDEPQHVLPSGLPRSCCDASPPLSPDDERSLIASLQSVVGKSNVLTSTSHPNEIGPYTKGSRLGKGHAVAVIKPTSFTQVHDAMRVILKHKCVILPQGANTGLTGGSVPRDGTSRPFVILNLRNLREMLPVDSGERLLCTAGVGISDASDFAKRLGRESHSVLGSFFLNPTCAAGVAYGSGGTQLRKGPAFTERSLYVKVKEDGESLEVMNTLGLKGLGDGLEGEELLRHLDEAILSPFGEELESDEGGAPASDTSYRTKVCDTQSCQVARCNSDTSGLEINRSEGKLMILATVHDTFPPPKATKTFWISCPDLETALQFRKHVVLDNPTDLPTSCEYMDRDSFDLVDQAGRIMAGMIKILGPGHSLIGTLWTIKLRIEELPLPKADIFPDKMLYILNNLFPATLSSELNTMGHAYDHHLMITVGEYGGGTLQRFEDRMHQFTNDHDDKTKILIKECTPKESNSITAFRFVAASSFRTWCVGNGAQGISVDYALPRNQGMAPPLSSPNSDEPAPVKRMRYSHFGCNVVHEDLAFAPGVDVHKAKLHLKKVVEKECGGKLPAEHGHGMEYNGTDEAKKRWMEMDPSNAMNPGIGGLKTTPHYK